MRAPSDDELAAIAAAYTVLASSAAARPAPTAAPRWRIAGRLPALDMARARWAARGASRWSAAGRLDG